MDDEFVASGEPCGEEEEVPVPGIVEGAPDCTVADAPVAPAGEVVATSLPDCETGT